MIMASVSCKHGSWWMILLITLHISSHGAANSCYKGVIEDGTDNPDFPAVKQCDAREKRDSPSPTSPSPTQSAQPNTTEPTRTTTAPVNHSTPKEVPTPSSATTNQPTPPPSTRAPDDTQMCLRFAVEKTSGSLKFGKAVEWKVRYGCDTDNLCQGKTGTVDHKVTWNGESGTLYCCNNSDSCNPPVVQSCYSGLIGKKRLVQTTCPADTKFCVSSLDHVNGTVVGGQYSCSMVEHRDVCIRNGFVEPGCKNVTGPSGKPSTVCCCDTNNCNVPVNVTHHTMSPTARSPSDHPKHHKSGSINYAVPTAATIIIILVILTAVGGLCVWKKKRETGRGALSFTYSRLAADVAV
ncbi:uncharacterized protein [Branchiostoma lanceolatum]|uniref:uncharacterized protein n=1 Tax=Branchiostoma lanceolatum TaxID=7740 RepID=UPI0034544BB3